MTKEEKAHVLSCALLLALSSKAFSDCMGLFSEHKFPSWLENMIYTDHAFCE